MPIAVKRGNFTFLTESRQTLLITAQASTSRKSFKKQKVAIMNDSN